MSSELTIDIQLTEMGFSSWDLKLIGQKDRPSEPESSSSSCLVPGDEEANQKDQNLSSDDGTNQPVHSDESPGEDDRLEPESSSGESEQVRKKRKLEVDDDGDEEDEEDEDEWSSDITSSEENCCPVCNLTFTTTSQLHQHLRVHSGVHLYICAECNKKFYKLQHYQLHLRSHAPTDPFHCVVCRTPFASEEELRHHLDTNHFEDKFYECDLCKRIFTSMNQCQKHVRMHRPRSRPYQCPKCERSFRHHNSMVYHLRRHRKGKLVCNDCGMTFFKKISLLRHSFHHMDLPPYTCVHCKHHFQLAVEYRKHDCKMESLQCVACMVIFQNQEEFKEHKRKTGCWGHQTDAVAKADVIRCMECGQVFDSSEELRKHAGTHQRILKCSECGKGFRSSIMLMSHMGGHVAQNPCLCKVCGLGFCHQQAYDGHLKTCGLVPPPEASLKNPKLKQDPVVESPVPGQQGSPPLKEFKLILNKESASSVPLVMFLPVKPENISNPEASVETKKLGEEPASELPSESTEGCSTGAKILVPMRSESDKLHWTVMNQPGSARKIYMVKKVVTQSSVPGQREPPRVKIISIIKTSQPPKDTTPPEKAEAETRPDCSVQSSSSLQNGDASGSASLVGQEGEVPSSQQDQEFTDGPDMVQCETCGQMLQEKDLPQHSQQHGV